MFSVPLTQPLTEQFNCSQPITAIFPIHPATASDSPYLCRLTPQGRLETEVQLQMVVRGWSGTRNGRPAPKPTGHSRNYLNALLKNRFDPVVVILVISRVSSNIVLPLVEILFRSRRPYTDSSIRPHKPRIWNNTKDNTLRPTVIFTSIASRRISILKAFTLHIFGVG